MTKTDKHNVLIVLKGLKWTCWFNTAGICYHLDYHAGGLAQSVMREYVRDWEHYSGSIVYPVPHENGAARGYENTTFMFNPLTKYGRMRINLLNYLIKRLEEDLV